jgi:hypothetical protein
LKRHRSPAEFGKLPVSFDIAAQQVSGQVRWCGGIGSGFFLQLFRCGLGEIAIHHGPAACAQTHALLHHAGGDPRDIGNLGAAQPERIPPVHICWASGLKA